MQSNTDTSKRPLSPETTGGNERKRRRKVLSCYDCRRRKLQCDRAMPACSRCTKAGQAANCLYLEDGMGPPSRPDNERIKGPFDTHVSRPIQVSAPVAPPLGDTLSRLEYQDKRIKQLEATLAQTGPTQILDPVQKMKVNRLPLTPESVLAAAEQIGATITDRETMILRGKSFKTHFHGTTQPSSLIAHIPDLNEFTKTTFENHPVLTKIRHDVHTLHDRNEIAEANDPPVTGEQLKAMLPPKAEADDLVTLYLQNYDPIYHVLHLPSFWKEYNELWSVSASARPHLVALVLLMMAASQCLTSTQPWLYTADSSTARDKAVRWIQACDHWLQMQSQKHVTATDFQIRFLLLLARQVSARKYKRTWTDSGTLLRFCMAAGLHRDPDLIRKKTSVLDQELRRRLWQAVVELELQASFDRGMIPAPWPMQCDCPPPSNIRDEQLDHDTEVAPPAARPSEFTSSSYLATASDSTLLRHRICTILNSIRQTLSFDDVKRSSEDIEAHLQNIPEWNGDAADGPRALLSLNLRQYLLALHDRQIRQAYSMAERSFSRIIIIDTATRIIETHKRLIDSGSHALELMCHDQLRAALSMCHVATTYAMSADSALASILEHHTDRVMEDAVEMITDKVTRFGREQRQLWIVLAAHGVWKTKKDPDQRAVYMQEAVDKITRPYYKMMACQEDGPVSSSLIDNGRSAPEANNSTMQYLPSAPRMQREGELAGSGDPPLFDMDDIEAWTFDDWTFNSVELQQALEDPFPPVIP